jgi:hypothetical protein
MLRACTCPCFSFDNVEDFIIFHFSKGKNVFIYYSIVYERNEAWRRDLETTYQTGRHPSPKRKIKKNQKYSQKQKFQHLIDWEMCLGHRPRKTPDEERSWRSWKTFVEWPLDELPNGFKKKKRNPYLLLCIGQSTRQTTCDELIHFFSLLYAPLFPSIL